jgi:FAD/FMN-containing dehydrogenase
MNPATCHVYRPEKRRGTLDVLQQGDQSSYIARGLGRSYGDAATNADAGVIDVTRLNRLISFDAESGVVECEAGVSLATLIDIFMPRGYFLSVSPGTKYVTVGGAIANDIHGKNHHRCGSFGEHVQSLMLLTASGDILTCSRESNSDLFWATVGGAGLTGIIVSARISLQRVESAYMVLQRERVHSLDEALGMMAERDADHQYSVMWLDCLARGKHLGRGVMMHADHAPVSALSGSRASHPLDFHAGRKKSVPLDAPGFVLNPLSIRLFNTLYYARNTNVHDYIVDYDQYFYPLDGVLHWNRMYGKAGFAQYQATLPPDSVGGLVKLLERLSDSRRASFLAVLKRFGPEGEGLLSHPFEGYTLTLDIPNRPGLVDFLHELDALVLDHGGRLYFAKDAVARPEVIADMYPRLEAFREVKKRVDPDGCFDSTLARRLQLTEGVAS